MIALGVVVFAFLLGIVAALGGVKLLSTNVSTGTTASASGLEVYTGNGGQEITIVRGGTEDQVIKWNADNTIGWGDDATSSISGAGAVAFDAGDDDANESSGLNEIATTGDTNSIFSESGDKLTIAAGNNWPTADAATALSANGANCSANQFNKGVDASGAAESCAALVDADVPNTITIDLAATATALAANPSDCAASNFGTTIAANGDLTCAQPAFSDITGAATDAQIPNGITIDNATSASTATALAANGANCSAGSAPLGVDASGAAESCTNFEEDLVNSGGLATAISDETGSGVVVFGTSPTLDGTVSITGAGTTFTVNLDCTGNSNGGALTANAAGLIACSDDDGGAGGNSFETIVTDAGTSPSASGSDTLNLTSTNATVSITGTAGSDTVDFAVTADAITTDELADGSDAPAAGECVLVATGASLFEYATCPGGGSQNLFETISTPFGTSPVADATTDTLTLDSPLATVSITGASGSDTVSFDVLTAPRLTANGANCLAGEFNKGVDAFGAVESCAALLDSDIPDTITIDNATLAATATALAANPADCAANQFAQSIVASGNLTCAAIADADVPDSITIDLAATATALAADPSDCSAGTKATAIADSGNLTCSAVDVSADTNLTAGRSLTLTGDDVLADAELYTIKKSISMLAPVTGAMTNLAQFEYATATTITEISCSTDVGTVTIQFDERARVTPNTSGTDVLSSSLVCDNDSQTSSSFANAGIAADVPVNLQIISGASSPGVVRIHIKATKDD